MPEKVTVRKDDALSSRVIRSSSLVYANEARTGVEDRPEHVRAASSLVYLIDRFALVQDDANFLALVDPTDHRVESHPLPPVPGGGRVHGSKRKLDLEACAVVPGTDGRLLLALASGTGPSREWIVTIDWRVDSESPEALLHEAPAFFAALRENEDFCGAGINIEGAVFIDDDTLRLFQRGNARPTGDLAPVDATGDVHWPALAAYLNDPEGTSPPSVDHVVQYDLGALDGVRLTFSDAEPLEDGRMLFSASAEAPDDGRIVGSVLGVIVPDGSARWAELFAEDGSPFNGKIEGLSLEPGASDHVFFVIDSDSAEDPSRIYEADLDGPWGVAER